MKGLKLINYEVSYEPMKGDYEFTSEEREFAQKSHDVLANGKKITPQYIKSLENAIAKYPLNPSLKNYLATAYKIVNDSESLTRIAHQTIEEHPDYFFGKAVLAELYLKEEEFEKAAALMGKFSDISIMYPDRKLFHVSEVKMFQMLASEYFAALGDIEQMEIHLKMLASVSDKRELQISNQRCKLKLMEATLKKMSELQKAVKNVYGSFRGKNRQTTKAPIFQNVLIEELYHQDLLIGEGILTAILALPKESLIEDLEKVLDDAINRYEFFLKNSNADESKESFATHAIMLLGELQSYRSLPKILDFLKQGDKFVEFWLMDVMGSLLLRPLYLLGKEELSQLEGFLKEPDVFWMVKTTVSNVLKNIAELDASKREEVTNVFENVLDFYWENQHDEAICDHTVISSLCYDMAYLQITHLKDSMKRFYDAKLIDKGMNGDWKELMELYQYPAKPKISAVPTLVETYGQYARGEFDENYVTYQEHPVMEKRFSEMRKAGLDKLTSSFSGFDDDDEEEDDYFLRPTQPLISTKIDRNAKVNVRYTDGKEVKEVKYKKVEDDVLAGKCVIV